MLEKLTPTERAAYILREALDYPYERIAGVIGATVASARQLVSRARKHLASARRVQVAQTEQRRLLEASSPPPRKAMSATSSVSSPRAS